jgi:hypothetical protein
VLILARGMCKRRGAGAKPGLEIWRIENKVPVRVPEKQVDACLPLASCTMHLLSLLPAASHILQRRLLQLLRPDSVIVAQQCQNLGAGAGVVPSVKCTRQQAAKV